MIMTRVIIITYGHNRVRALACGHKHVWAQSYLGTVVSRHNRVASMLLVDEEIGL